MQGDHLGNVLRARAFEHRRQMAFADAPTDRSRWLMLPQQINAYYHPNLNEIVFPAAILRPKSSACVSSHSGRGGFCGRRGSMHGK